MKHYLLLCLIATLINNSLLFSQGGRSIRVNAGDDMAQAFSPIGFNRFPAFSPAVLYFKAGRQKTGLLFNYNYFSGNVQYIAPKGDTLDMITTPDMDSIVFGKTVFMFYDGFMEIIAETDSFRLMKKVVLKTTTEKIGAYGTSNPTASIDNIRTINTRAGVYSLVINQDVVLNEYNYWFFSNGTTILKANKTNLLKLLPAEKQAKAEAYLKQNKTNFERENDLKKLMEAIRS